MDDVASTIHQSLIDGRTTADCVVYYYQRQKTEDGFRGRRKAQQKKRRAYAEAKRMTGGRAL